MKRARLFIVSSLAMILGVGMFAGASLFNETEKPTEVEAASGDATGRPYTFYCDWGAGTASWATKYVGYCTSTSGDDWTWVAMTQVNGTLWSADISEPEVKRLIFRHTQTYYKGCSTDPLWTSDNNGIQNRFNITSRAEGQDPGFYGSWAWETGCSYTVNFNSNGGSGSMSSQQRWIYSNSGGSTIKTNTFTRTGYTFKCWNTEADGSGRDVSDGATLNYGSALSMINGDTVTLYAQWTKTYSAGRYVIGSFCNWNIDGAVLMNSGTEFTANVTLSYGDEFKLADYNGSSFTTYYGYSSSIGGGLFCFSQVTTADESYNNFKCWAGGTYSIYSTSGEYQSGKNISIEISGTKWNAEQLAAKLMSFGEWAGHCGDDDRFPTCKEKYIEMESSEQTKFQGYASSSTDQFRNAYLRYTSWASALGENPWASGKLSSSSIVLRMSSESASTLIVVISIAAISLAAIGGYFLFRKKKEN